MRNSKNVRSRTRFIRTADRAIAGIVRLLYGQSNADRRGQCEKVGQGDSLIPEVV
jgi:hypothetical protein